VNRSGSGLSTARIEATVRHASEIPYDARTLLVDVLIPNVASGGEYRVACEIERRTASQRSDKLRQRLWRFGMRRCRRIRRERRRQALVVAIIRARVLAAENEAAAAAVRGAMGLPQFFECGNRSP
jgi:hypothetical protein